MINKLFWIKTDNTYPYKNIALEEYLTMNVNPGECILYLWQNRHTVVIGKNQNCWKECNITELEKDGGFLARRLSGGGAVFHDLGNLNFTFCVRAEDYDLDKQIDVILRSVKSLGITAEKTGRNDITIQGKKFSGNAFLRIGDFCYHHGTIMMNVDIDKMQKYLNVDKSKLISKGVNSVSSRVTSLIEFKRDINVTILINALIKAFEDVYGLKAQELKEEDIEITKLASLTEKFASWEWKYGRKIPFTKEFCKRFSWGDIQLQLNINQGIIQDVNLFSDSMDQSTIMLIGEALKECKYNVDDITNTIKAIETPIESGSYETSEKIKNDIIEFLEYEI